MKSTRISPRRLSKSFFRNPDVLAVSRSLLGKVLVSTLGEERTSGMIVETEAYRAPDDKACHAYDNRRTERTEIMFAPGGHAYIYLCYGIHHLFNVVTGPKNEAQAVLIRSLQPLEGLETMSDRRGMAPSAHALTNGPGKLSQALRLTTANSGTNMLADDAPFFIEDRDIDIGEDDIERTPRIGVDYAEESADWLWRFMLRGNEWVSG